MDVKKGGLPLGNDGKSYGNIDNSQKDTRLKAKTSTKMNAPTRGISPTLAQMLLNP